MGRNLIYVTAAVLLLAGCGAAEPAELTQPYNVETAKKAMLQLEQQLHQTTTARAIEIAEAVVVEEDETIESEGTTSEHEDSTSEPKEATSEHEDSTSEAVEVEQAVEQVVEQVVEEEPMEYAEVYSEDYYEQKLPPPAETFEEPGQYIGTYTVTWYSREAVGYDAPGASGNGLTPYYSCAMPDYGLLNCTILVEGYGFFHVDDISPAGIVDLYVASNADIPGYGQGTANVYLVG